MKRLLCVVLLVCSPLALAAQTIIRGDVTDAQTGAPIAQATIAVEGTSAHAVTNATGVFTLTTDGHGTSIAVSRTGYTTQRVPVAAAAVELHIRLVASHAQLPGVQVVANKSTPAIAVITRSDLQRSSGLSLENAINAVPGLFMQSRTPWGGARITIRGYYPSTSGNSPNSNGLGYEVFMNDIPLTDASGATILDDVDYSMLGNVDVIKGPASSLYGNAIGGTVRLTTLQPPPGQTSFGQQLLGGSNGLLRTNTTFKTATNSSSVLLNYGHQSYNSFRPHSASHKEYASAAGNFNVADNQTVSSYFAYNRSFEELAGEIDSTDFYQRNPVSNLAYLANDSHIQITSFIAGLTDHYRIGDRFTNQTTIFGNGRSYAQPFAHGFTDANQFSFGARSVFTYAGKLGATDVTGSVGAMLQRTNIATNGVFIVPAPPYPQRPTDQENYAANASLFTEWNFAMPGSVTLTVGASLNKNQFGIRNMLKNNVLYDTSSTQTRKFDAVFTPRVAVTKGFGANTSLYASVSSGYTPPLLSNTIANTGAVDLSLKPERALQYEVGTQSSLLDNRLSSQIALFDVENTDKLITETSNSITFTTNAGKQRDRGAELSLSYLAVNDKATPVSLLRPWFSYTYTDSKFVDFRSDNNNNPATVDFSGNAVPRVPRNMVNAGIDVGTHSGVYLNSSYRYVDRTPVTFDNSTYVRSYDLLGAKIGYRKQVDRHWNLDAFAGGDNLLGSTNYSFLFVGPNIKGLRQAADGGTGDGYIIPAPYKATFYGSVSVSYTF